MFDGSGSRVLEGLECLRILNLAIHAHVREEPGLEEVRVTLVEPHETAAGDLPHDIRGLNVAITNTERVCPKSGHALVHSDRVTQHAVRLANLHTRLPQGPALRVLELPHGGGG